MFNGSVVKCAVFVVAAAGTLGLKSSCDTEGRWSIWLSEKPYADLSLWGCAKAYRSNALTKPEDCAVKAFVAAYSGFKNRAQEEPRSQFPVGHKYASNRSGKARPGRENGPRYNRQPQRRKR